LISGPFSGFLLLPLGTGPASLLALFSRLNLRFLFLMDSYPFHFVRAIWESRSVYVSSPSPISEHGFWPPTFDLQKADPIPRRPLPADFFFLWCVLFLCSFSNPRLRLSPVVALLAETESPSGQRFFWRLAPGPPAGRAIGRETIHPSPCRDYR